VRHRYRRLLNALAVVVLAAGCEISADGSDDARSVRHLPSAEAREYCRLVAEFYERLDAWFAAAQERLGSDATEAALDQRYVGFVRENQPLFDELEEAAPDKIADAAATQAQAFADVATQGSLAPLETESALAAERVTVAYEAEVCGIVVE
jgi:hypothetical protein